MSESTFETDVHYALLEFSGHTVKGNPSLKFYEAMWGKNSSGLEFAVYRWGKVGTQGQTQMKTGADARPGNVRDKLLEKRGKGYDTSQPDRRLTIPSGIVDFAIRHGDGDRLAQAASKALDSPFGRHPELEDELEGTNDSYYRRAENAAKNGHTSLSERALTLISKAAISPSEVYAEYALLQNEISEERQKINDAERSLRTLEVMLGIDNEG